MLKIHDWLIIIGVFHTALVDAQTLRPQMNKWITNLAGKDSELEWMLYEKQVMFNLVNDYRTKNNLEPIPMEDIERVERLACGHCDYTRKFSLYCSELAVGKDIFNE